MRLSKLSDRQLRRLIRNADVRFALFPDNERLLEVARLLDEYQNKFWKLRTKYIEELRGNAYGIKNQEFRKVAYDSINKIDDTSKELARIAQSLVDVIRKKNK